MNVSFKKLVIALIMTGALAFSSIFAMAEENVKVYVNGEQLTFDVNPIIENGRVLVPMRAIFEALGATVDWDEETQTVSAIRKNENIYKTITMQIGDNQMFTYSRDSTAEIPPPGMARIELDVPPTIIDGRTLVPVRAISESFGAKVEWDDTNKSVIITEPEDGYEQERWFVYEPELAITEFGKFSLEKALVRVRSKYEHYDLRNYAFQNGNSIYELMLDVDSFGEEVYGIWNESIWAYVMDVFSEEFLEYELENGRINTDWNWKQLGDIIIEEGVDGNSVIRAVHVYESNQGTRIAVVEFKAVDVEQCRYIAITATDEGKVRYFVEEKNLSNDRSWLVKEEKADGTISTLTILGEIDAERDFINFASTVINFCDN